MVNDPDDDEAVHIHPTLDWRVPIALILTIFLQTIALVGTGSWFLSKLDARVDANMLGIQTAIIRLAIIEIQQDETAISSARFDQRMIAFDRHLRRFEEILGLYRDQKIIPEE